MSPRDTNLAIIEAMTGRDPALDDQIQNTVIEQLGTDAFVLSDDALALIAAEYTRQVLESALPASLGRH